MVKKLKAAVTLCLCGWMMLAMPQEAEASENYVASVEVETTSSYIVKVDAPKAALYESQTENSEKVDTLSKGETYEVISYEDGWALLDTGSSVGYLKVSDYATMVERTYEKVDKEAELRNEAVRFGLQFVGNRYVYGGTDPNTGVDCSGFTSYIMRHVAGVSLSHSGAIQSKEGTKVKEPKAGDLIFYSNGKRINHVAMYIGNGQVVHASSKKTGIKVSTWNYREPVAIVDVIS